MRARRRVAALLSHFTKQRVSLASGAGTVVHAVELLRKLNDHNRDTEGFQVADTLIRDQVATCCKAKFQRDCILAFS